MAKQVRRQQSGLAEQGMQAGVARQRHARKLDRKVAQIKRVTDRDKAHHKQPLDLIGGKSKRGLFHRVISWNAKANLAETRANTIKGPVSTFAAGMQDEIARWTSSGDGTTRATQTASRKSSKLLRNRLILPLGGTKKLRKGRWLRLLGRVLFGSALGEIAFGRGRLDGGLVVTTG